MEIVLIGISHRTATIQVRERLAFRVDQACDAADQLRANGILEEAVILSTCNRTELYGVTHDRSVNALGAMETFLASYHQVDLAELHSVLYQHTDRAAVRHIYRVAAGLDSLLLGESEILGQVREAYQVAMKHGATGRVLNRLFQSALEVGKRIRTETEIATRPMSVAFAGVKQAETLLPGLPDRRVLVVGAGATSEQVVKHLRNRGVPQFRILNRTRENAEVLVARYGGEVLAWEKLDEALDWPDLVVSSVSTVQPILTRKVVERAMAAREQRPLVIMDLGVPRNVAEDVNEISNVHLSDIDGLTKIVEQNKKAREEDIPQALSLIEDQIDGFMRWQAGVTARSVCAQLREAPVHKHNAIVREHMAAMVDYTLEERAHFIRLLDRFLLDGHGESVACLQGVLQSQGDREN
jgi:glutamyl-tRNA reductase